VGAHGRRPLARGRRAARAMKVVLVTGASGFIGCALVPRLVAAGYTPRLLVRTPLEHPPPGVEVVTGDVADPRPLGAAAAGAEAIVHLAAATSSGRLDPAIAYRVNVGAASALVEASRASGARVIVLSTQHVYLPRPGLYGRTKRMADRLLLDSGIPVTVLRPSLVYGPGTRGVFVKLADVVRRLPVVPVVGEGTWQMRPVFLDDLVSVIVDVLGRPELAGRVYDVGGPESVSFNAFVAAIAEAAGRRARTVHLPLRMAFGMAWVLERVLPKPPLTTDNVRGAVTDARCDPRPLERDCRAPRTPLAAGLSRALSPVRNG
jgi:nucleoside-diphosphate-sugar epimerase